VTLQAHICWRESLYLAFALFVLSLLPDTLVPNTPIMAVAQLPVQYHLDNDQDLETKLCTKGLRGK